MLQPYQIEFLKTAKAAAVEAGCKFPGATAAEAAEESGWGKDLPPNSNNYLGIKAMGAYKGPSVDANGTEQNPNGTWTGKQPDKWRVYPDMVSCFKDQIHILNNQRHADGSLAYASALAAHDPVTYITEECRVWSTGQAKGTEVLKIYNSHKDILG